MARFTALGSWDAVTDRDWYAVSLAAGTSYAFSLAESLAGSGSLALRAADGTAIASGSAGFTHTPATSGTYYLSAESIDAVGSYALGVASYADDAVDHAATGLALAVGNVASASWDVAGDVDWWAIGLAAGQSISAMLDESLAGSGSLVIRSADGGRQSATGTTLFGSASLAFTADAAGTYYLVASSGGAVGRYALAVGGLADDAPDSATTGLAATPGGGSAAGSWGAAGDEDWFAVSLAAGITYRLALTEALSGSGTIALRAADGTSLGTSQASSTGTATLDVTVASSGTYYLAARSGGALGSYTVALEAVTDPELGSAATGASLTVGGSASGGWGGPGDADWFAVSLIANQSYLASLGESLAGDGFLSLRNAAGTVTTLPSQTTTGSTTAFFTPAESGTYFLVAESRTATGSYTVALATQADDRPDNPTSGGSLAVGGSTTGQWEAAGDADWFAVSLVAGQSYLLSLGVSLPGAGSVRLRSADGGEISPSAGSSVFTPAASGTYYAVATSTDAVGAYALALAQLPGDIGATAASAGDMLPLEGGAGADRLDGTSGDDSLAGLGGTDTLAGLAGADTLDGGPGADWLSGDAGDDLYSIDTPGDLVFENFGTGNDTVIASAGFYLFDNIERLELAAGAGDIFGVGNSATNTLVGNAGANLLLGGDGDDTVAGGDGDDLAYGEAGSDSLAGEAGSDTLIGGEGADTLAGGTGADVVFGEAGDDSLGGDDGADTLYAGEGNDTLAGGEGIDALFGEGGDDSLSGGAGGDYLYAGEGADSLDGGQGDDVLFGEVGSDSLAGGDGADTLHAGAGADTLAGGDSADVLYGEAGDDSLDGGAGLDYLFAGIGADSLAGGAGADVLYGEAGDDSLSGGADFVFDMLVGGDGGDTLDGASGLGDYDYLYGGDGDDVFHVDTPFDLVFEFAAEGNDTVHADISGAGYYLYEDIEDLVLLGATPFGVGNGLGNRLTGNAAANYLLGGAGADTLNGKAGGDVLFGEAGADLFVFERGSGGDVIGDFTPGQDRIQLSGLGFTGFAQVQAALSVVGSDSAIDLGQGDFIVINGVTGFTAGDFVFA